MWVCGCLYVLNCIVCSPLIVPKSYIQWDNSPSHWQCYTHTHTHSTLHSQLPSHPSGPDSTHLAWAREFQQSVLFILLSFILTDILWLRALCLSLSLYPQSVRELGREGSREEICCQNMWIIRAKAVGWCQAEGRHLPGLLDPLKHSCKSVSGPNPAALQKLPEPGRVS